MIDPLLEIGPHVTALPVVHGSGDFAWEVRRLMMKHDYDCLAVALPPSFQQPVEAAIMHLPTPSVVVQHDTLFFPHVELGDRPFEAPTQFDPDRPMAEDDDAWFEDDDEGMSDEELDEADKLDKAERGLREPGLSYVPIDPCQPYIAALRTALGDRKPRRFIDMETSQYLAHSRAMPDAFALKRMSLDKYAAAVLPFIESGRGDQWTQRMDHMAWQLRELSVDFKKILFVTSVLDWPWIRQAFQNRDLVCPEHEPVEDVLSYQVHPKTLYFLLGELPFITSLYERARHEIQDDEHLAIDGVKELLIASRDAYRDEYKNRARSLTPAHLSNVLKYTRNLTLIERGFSPQLATIVTAAQQVAGDGYALHVLEMAKAYEYVRDLGLEQVQLAIEHIMLPDGEVMMVENRLPGPPMVWTELKLLPRPDKRQQQDWQQKWNPYAQCSWPPEDDRIESFRRTVFDRAKEAMGLDLAQTEKFTTSVKDGIDIRETVRHWYDGEIHVKVLPPSGGKMDTAVMLFDSPAEPQEYPWRTTWFAEHDNESTLAFFATSFADNPVGPGICQATYGGALFIFPPVGIVDIWQDPRLDYATTLEERLLGAACLHSRCKHVALLSAAPPGQAWRGIAKAYGKSLVHLPLSRFSDATIEQLRMVHVLNGKEVRSHAADFIRRY